LIVGQLADHLSDPAARDAARSYCSDPSSIREPLLRSRAIQPCLESELLSVDALRTLSEDAHWAVRARLARALTSRAGAHLKSSSAAGLLQRLSEDEHPTVRRAARGDADPV
jgi:hypothetical protein